MHQRILLFFIVIALTPLSSLSVQAQSKEQPNILLIVADDVGQEALGCYGGTSYKTPNLDKLAETGTRFNYGFSMPVCHPSRTTILTGLYPFQMGRPRWGSFPKKYETQTFAHALKKLGYTTAVVGKWQLAMLKNDLKQPHRLGFEEYSLFGWHEGPRYWQPHIWQNGKLRKDVKDRYGPDVYCDYLIDFMVRNKKGPFLAYYPMALCHDVSDDLKVPPPYGPGRDQYESFGEMVEKMDGIVGRLVAALDKHGLRKNTIIIFTTDNGSPRSMIIRTKDGRFVRVPVYSMRNGQRIRGGKGTLTDAGTRVPFIVNAPGRVPAGKTTNTLVDFSDFYTTLVTLAGGKKELAPGGYNFMAGLSQDTKEPQRSWVYAEHRGKYFVRSLDWKLYGDGSLYNMQADPQEKNAIKIGEGQAKARAARQQLQKALKELGRNK